MGKVMVNAEQLRRFGHAVFMKMGCEEEEARLATDVLLKADLRGVDSHGFARLKGYVQLWKAGRIKVHSKTQIRYETPSTAVLDGDAGMGLVVAPKAMRIAMQKADVCGTGWVAVCNSNHFGIAAYHAMLALKENMIGIAMTNASPLVAPTFSAERLLGTNPICVAIPAGTKPSFVADFSTTTAANGKLEILQRENKKAPPGWAQQKDGKATTDPAILKKGGALTPLGSDYEHSSHKGFCLGAWVDIFSSMLSGANYGPWVPPFVHFLAPPSNPVGKGVGHFFGALRIDAFRPATAFKKDMDTWIERMRQAKTVAGRERVIIPGDPERNQEAQRKARGIPLHTGIAGDLRALGEEFAIPFANQ